MSQRMSDFPVKTFMVLLLLLLSSFLTALVVVNPGLSTEEIVYDADTIVHGRIVSKESRWINDLIIKTFYTVEIYEVLFDSPDSPYLKSGNLMLSFFGGEIEEVGMKIAGIPVFDTGEELLLFLEKDNHDGLSPLVGCYQGVVKLKDKSQAEKLQLINELRSGIETIKTDSRNDWRVRQGYSNVRRSSDESRSLFPPLTINNSKSSASNDFNSIALSDFRHPLFENMGEPQPASDQEEYDRRRSADNQIERHTGTVGEIFSYDDTRYYDHLKAPDRPIVWNIPPVYYNNPEGNQWGEYFEGALTAWNYYATNIHRKSSNPDNTIGYRNDRYDMGFMTPERFQAVFGHSLDGKLAVCYSLYNAITKRIYEANIIFNTDHEWTTRFSTALDPNTPNNCFYSVALHEIGHSIGIGHPFEGPSWDDCNSVMAYSGKSLRAVHNKLFMIDAKASRDKYPSRTAARDDFGVYLHYTTPGKWNVHWSEFSDEEVMAGSVFDINNIVLENLGTVPGSRFLTFYLTTMPWRWDNAIYRQMLTLRSPELQRNEYWKFNQSIYVPQDMRGGLYWVAIVIDSDDNDHNRVVWSYQRIRVHPDYPNAPSNLTVTSVSTNEVNLQWRDNSNNEYKFMIERRTDRSDWALIGDRLENRNTYRDRNLSEGTTYLYRVKANNARGDSDWSNIIQTTTYQTKPDPPTNLTATAWNASLIKLQWTDNSDNENGFRVERRTEGGQWQLLSSTVANTTVFYNSNLSPVTRYYYRVASYNTGGQSDWSNVADAVTPQRLPDAPGNLNATAVSASAINVTWTDNSDNETGFRLEYRKGQTGTWVGTNLAANATQYQQQDLEHNTTYYFRVRAFNQAGNSDWSNTGNATTNDSVPNKPYLTGAVPVSASEIRVEWEDRSDNEVGFRIYRRQGTVGGFEYIGWVQDDNEFYLDTGLSPSTTYYYRVEAFNFVGVSGFENIVNATTMISPPRAPDNLSATAVSSSQINISWSDLSNDELGFRIQRREGEDGEWTLVGQPGANSTSFQFYGLTPNTTYYFRVCAYSASGNSSWSNIADATTQDTHPDAPSNLVARTVSSTQINLSWTNNAHNTDFFRVDVKVEGGDWTFLTNHAMPHTSLQHFNREPDTRYYYRVRAHNIALNAASAWSNEASAFTGGSTPVPPSDLEVTSVSSTQITIGWTDNSDNEDGFKVERKVEDGDWSEITQVGSNGVQYQNSGLEEGVNYYYRVRAYNAAGNSDYTATVHRKTIQHIPAIPHNVRSYAISPTRIDVTWEDRADSETGFRIYRSTWMGNYQQVGQVGANVTSYQDTNVAPNTRYYHLVKSYNDNGESESSNIATAITPSVPAAPTNLAAADTTCTSIRLTWTDNANNETGFHVERRVGPFNWVQIAELDVNAVEYNNTGLSNKLTYTYRVRAFNDTGNSDYSNEIVVTTKGAPSAPDNLSLVSASDNRIVISWNDNSDDETGFVIERRTAGVLFSTHAELPADTTLFVDVNLQPNTTYYYNIRAVNVCGFSGYSNVLEAATDDLVAPPSNLSATFIAVDEVRLTWEDKSNNETGFRIERLVGNNTEWELLVNKDANTTVHNDEDLDPYTTYQYRVRAFNEALVSEWSNTVFVTTIGVPAAPTHLRAISLSEDEVILHWINNSSNEDGFRIERRVNEDGEWTQITTVDTASVRYDDNDLPEARPNTVFYYRVRAFNEAGNSDYTNVADVVTRVMAEDTDEGSLAATGGTSDEYSATIDGVTVVFVPGEDEEEEIEIEVIISTNPNYPPILFFANPAALGRYFGFNVDNIDVFLNGISVSIEFAVRPNQLWFRPGVGPWVLIPEEAIDWSDPLRPVVSLGMLFYEGRRGGSISRGTNRTRENLFEFAGDRGEVGETLPVELSSFTAAETANRMVVLKWVTETENNMLGYNIFRGLTDRQEYASVINRTLIQAYNTSQRREYTYTDRDVQQGGSYYYWLQTYDFDLTSGFYGPIYIHLSEEGEEGSIPGAELITELIGAYPNPFNPGTNIRFSLSEKVDVSIRIYNMKGQLINILTENVQYDRGAGHFIYWDGKDDNGKEVGSGVYLYHLKAGSYEAMKKMLLVK